MSVATGDMEVRQGGGEDGFCGVARCLGGAAVSGCWLANKASVGAAPKEKSVDDTALKKLVKLSCICLMFASLLPNEGLKLCY